MKLFRIFAILSASLLLFALPASADRVKDSELLVMSMITAVQTVLRDEALDKPEKQAAIKQVMDEYFDVQGITRAAAGQYWRKATSEQRARYTELLTDVLATKAVKQFKFLTDLEFEPTKSTEKGPKMVLVGGRIIDHSGARPDTIVNWRVATKEGQPPAIIDIEIENISMLITQRQENQAILRKNNGDFDALIRSLLITQHQENQAILHKNNGNFDVLIRTLEN